ncbi:MAG: glycosyltransferase [Chthonomonadales bacterium]|nr:glycosyltransferase [Chthonomonadales bacterium]
MRFLILDTDYSGFLTDLYGRHRGLEMCSFAEQAHVRAESLFGSADFRSQNLRLLGHEAHEIWINNAPMMCAWAVEHGFSVPSEWELAIRYRRGIVPWIYRRPAANRFDELIIAQVKHYRPDVVFNIAMRFLSGGTLREIRRWTRALVGYHGSPIDMQSDYGQYDLIVSLLPDYVAQFRKVGLKAELCRLGFEPDILDRLHHSPPHDPVDVSFVGSVSSLHIGRIRLLEALCERTPIQIWANDFGALDEKSPICGRAHGPVWGLDMYRVLQASRITVNAHGEIANRYAANMRMYEATGVGTLLVTDWKPNLDSIFAIGEEVVAYRTPEECADLIISYLNSESARRGVAAAGQRRTLAEHTYRHRMGELVELVSTIL